MSYIVKNCPYDCMLSCKSSYVDEKYCHKCTDCKLKQIVEKCKAVQKEYLKRSTDGELDMFVSGRNNLACIILALLDIQEIE